MKRLMQINKRISQTLGVRKPERLLAHQGTHISYFKDVWPLDSIDGCLSGEFYVSKVARELVKLNTDWVDVADLLVQE